MNGTGWLELLAPLSIASALVVTGLLSRRFGKATRAAPYYVGFFVAAALVAVSVAIRLANLLLWNLDAAVLAREPVWVLLYSGLPALGVTMGVVIAWRYWSWLLAERD